MYADLRHLGGKSPIFHKIELFIRVYKNQLSNFDIEKGKNITTRVSDGEIVSTVTHVKENSSSSN